MAHKRTAPGTHKATTGKATIVKTNTPVFGSRGGARKATSARKTSGRRA